MPSARMPSARTPSGRGPAPRGPSPRGPSPRGPSARGPASRGTRPGPYPGAGRPRPPPPAACAPEWPARPAGGSSRGSLHKSRDSSGSGEPCLVRTVAPRSTAKTTSTTMPNTNPPTATPAPNRITLGSGCFASSWIARPMTSSTRPSISTMAPTTARAMTVRTLAVLSLDGRTDQRSHRVNYLASHMSRNAGEECHAACHSAAYPHTRQVTAMRSQSRRTLAPLL
jgi:hypothetical protein